MIADVKIMERKYYSSNRVWVDGTKEFHALILEYLRKNESVVLEVGAGPGNRTSQLLKNNCKQLDGIDIDERVLGNSALTNSYVYDGKIFPVEEKKYHVIVADYVMEHVEYPKIMMEQLHKALLPGGVFIFRTPNIYHYVSLISRLSTQKFHVRVANSARAKPEDSIDPYPTFYRFNSQRLVRKLAENASLKVEMISMKEKQPSYLRFSKILYLLGVYYERIVNYSDLFSSGRANIFGVLRKNHDG